MTYLVGAPTKAPSTNSESLIAAPQVSEHKEQGG